mmetsp:Transcript_14417/g.36798  ORF Transcript_14417/g.36798 Transcript_14417/m.36798 type:complete len:212 (-) Transcript_14417:82-717(-)
MSWSGKSDHLTTHHASLQEKKKGEYVRSLRSPGLERQTTAMFWCGSQASRCAGSGRQATAMSKRSQVSQDVLVREGRPPKCHCWEVRPSKMCWFGKTGHRDILVREVQPTRELATQPAATRQPTQRLALKRVRQLWGSFMSRVPICHVRWAATVATAVKKGHCMAPCQPATQRHATMPSAKRASTARVRSPKRRAVERTPASKSSSASWCA